MTPQQVLDDAREEFEKKFSHSNTCVTTQFEDATNADCTCQLKSINSFLTSTLQAFIEAEIAREDGMKKAIYTDLAEHSILQMQGYNQAKDESIKHYQELLVTLKR